MLGVSLELERAKNVIEVLDTYKIKTASIEEDRPEKDRSKQVRILYTSQVWKKDTSLGVILQYIGL